MRRLIAIPVVFMAAALLAPGGDAAKPPKQPPVTNQITITASKSRIVYGSTAVVSGQLKTSPNAGQQVTIEQAPPPYTKFTKLADGTTDASGNYAFTVQPKLNTEFRVRAPKVHPAQMSSNVLVGVALKVTMRASDRTPRRGQRIRFSGVVTPAENGRRVAIERHTSSGWVRVSRTTLVAGPNGTSTYSRKLRVRHAGAYRAKVNGDVMLRTGKSRSVRLRLH